MTNPPSDSGSFLHGFWYVAAVTRDIHRGKTVHRTLLGEPILIGRDNSGDVFALKDTCPHRGTLLSRGIFDGETVECPYHGWRFATSGKCVAIPSQKEGQRPQAVDIRARSYPVRESEGIIWVFMGGNKPSEDLPDVPGVPEIGHRFQLHLHRTFNCNIDLAITGLMDPAHGAFVHASSIWRRHRDVRDKEKAFSPAPLGWRMDRHIASGNARAYRLFLGGAPETEITYTLPGIRVEHATTGKATYCGLTACTPIDANTTDVNHIMYWDIPGGAVLRGLVRVFANRFLSQDANAVLDMRDGQAFAPETMLVEDADSQIRWYYRLKKEWQQAQTDQRPFKNPIEPQTLRWRS
ncbi:MAG: aromatic ring-hydroxylating dioxygenase subunit alpha [Rhodospirillaceae bacterium]|nr:aromatic ring-hydroxylating dioxygenase subunit alpha [Rhodospirillaceae bacterium]